MITLSELLKYGSCSNSIHLDNLNQLLKKVNKFRTLYNQPMIVSSGYRTMEDHLRIYAEKGITDKKKIPLRSKHLTGQAVDFYDSSKKLKKFILENLDDISAIGLWLEDFKATPNWVHIQSTPYSSWHEGKSIFFIP